MWLTRLWMPFVARSERGFVWLASFRVRAIARSSMQTVNYLTLIDQQLRGEHIRDIEVAV
jgi:hypothetical protein